MLDIFSRHRSLTLLAGVLLAQVLLLAFQIKRAHDVRLIRYWAVELVTPVERAGTWTSSKVSSAWSGYIGLHNARRENARLHSELDQLEIRNRELETEAAEAHRLSTLLSFRESHSETQILAAQVIGASADPASHILFINRGERDHLRRNFAVITPDGVVGKIVEVFPSTAQVLLVNDKDSGVGALFEDSRTHGVVKGTGDSSPRMDYVVNDEKVHPGQVILTSGEDRIFPKGLLVGTVVDAKPGNPFQIITVQPAVRLDRLEDVMILLSQQELAPKKTDDATGAAIPPAPPAASETPSTAPASPGAIPNPKASAKPAANSPAATPR